MQTEVLIVGAGPTGLALALWLARLGVRVRIVDRGQDQGGARRAFALQARTLEFYDRLGLGADVLARGRIIETMSVHLDRDHTEAVPFGAFGRGLSPFPFVLVLLQDDHDTLLAEHLAAVGVVVERDCELVDLTDDGTQVRARLKTGRSADRVIEADYVCGCDGAGSVVRRLLKIDFPGHGSEEIFYVADLEAGGALTDGELHYVLAREQPFSVFPRRGRGRVRLIGVTPASVRQRLSQFSFDDIRGEITQAADIEVRKVEAFATYAVHQRIASQWRKGRVFLLGDASHIHSPAGGQGLNAGVGDAVNLAWKLGAVLREAADPTLLDTYERERREAARRIAATTDRAFALQARRGPLMVALRGALSHLAPEMMRIGLVRRQVFRTLSQLGVNYRRSRTGRGRTGRIAAGDRLPWLRLPDQADNFVALSRPFPDEIDQGPAWQPPELAGRGGEGDAGAYSIAEEPLGMGWQVQVYGEVAADLRAACADWGLALHAFGWAPAMRRAGFARNAVYLVRPDGYVAFTARRQDPAALAELLHLYGLRFRAIAHRGGLQSGLGAP